MNEAEQTETPVRVGWRRGDPLEELVNREWLLTNGLGGYASGTIGGPPTRRFHGLLVAALPAPLGRTMMLNHLFEELHLPGGRIVPLGGLDPDPGPLELPDALAEMRLENGRPVWRYEADGVRVEKRILVTYGQNTTRVSYRLIESAGPVTLVLSPALSMRHHEGRVDGEPPLGVVRSEREGLTLTVAGAPYPPLRIVVCGRDPVALVEARREIRLAYRTEQSRGYDGNGLLQVLGHYEVALAPGEAVVFTASTENWDQIEALDPAEATRLDDERRLRLLSQADPRLRRGLGAELVLAADQFVITPHVRPADEARLRAEGEEARTVIAGYHWFTDWGRDTMISLEGLTLLTGRAQEARDILHTFALHIRDGLIPNLFPEGGSEGLYHTADATLWFFHALDRYQVLTGDLETRRLLLPKLVEIVRQHLNGTRFGIGVDPDDGLLRQGAAGYQLTWMDAKVGDWVVTPRRGKAVEINALFFNALALLAAWLSEAERDGQPQSLGMESAEAAWHAERLRRSFNRRFWNEGERALYDVVDGQDGQDGREDPSFRPNQLLAIALPNPVLDPGRWQDVVRAVEARLLTPFGLRSLAPGHPDYKPRYYGDLRARDAAYHQGTIWGWLVGPFVDAWLRAFPGDKAGARRALVGLDRELSGGCIGSISEIFDAEPPFTSRGCVAQAWSVAEAVRALLATAE